MKNQSAKSMPSQELGYSLYIIKKFLLGKLYFVTLDTYLYKTLKLWIINQWLGGLAPENPCVPGDMGDMADSGAASTPDFCSAVSAPANPLPCGCRATGCLATSSGATSTPGTSI